MSERRRAQEATPPMHFPPAKRRDIVRFCLKLLGLVVLAGLLSGLLGHVARLQTSPAWGTESKQAKWDAIHADSYTHLFLGTSRVFYGLEPLYFDSLAHASGHPEVRSYNYGVLGLFTPENYDLLQHLLRDSSLHPSTIYAEVLHIEPPKPTNANNNRIKRWLGAHWAGFLIKEQFSERATSLLYKTYNAIAAVVAYLTRTYNFGLSGTVFAEHLGGVPPWTQAPYAPRGFFNLNEEMAMARADTNAKTQINERAAKFMKNGDSALARTRFASNLAVNSPALPKEVSAQHLAVLQNLQALAAKRGIKLVFMLMPRVSANQAKSVRGLVQAIAKQPTLRPNGFIEVANPNKWPELYTLQTSSDEAHVNNRGARILTRAFLEQAMAKGAL